MNKSLFEAFCFVCLAVIRTAHNLICYIPNRFLLKLARVDGCQTQGVTDT